MFFCEQFSDVESVLTRASCRTDVMCGDVILGRGHYVFIIFPMHLVILKGTELTCVRKDEKVHDLT